MGESEWIISKQPFFLSQSYFYHICDWMKKLWKIKSHTFLFIIIIYFSVHSYIYILVAKWKSMKNIDHLSGHTFSGELYHHKKWQLIIYFQNLFIFSSANNFFLGTYLYVELL